MQSPHTLHFLHTPQKKTWETVGDRAGTGKEEKRPRPCGASPASAVIGSPATRPGDRLRDCRVVCRSGKGAARGREGWARGAGARPRDTGWHRAERPADSARDRPSSRSPAAAAQAPLLRHSPPSACLPPAPSPPPRRRRPARPPSRNQTERRTQAASPPPARPPSPRALHHGRCCFPLVKMAVRDRCNL
jgi:hypothetical protein